MKLFNNFKTKMNKNGSQNNCNPFLSKFRKWRKGYRYRLKIFNQQLLPVGERRCGSHVSL